MKRVTIKSHGELVKARVDNIGNIVVEPASKRFSKNVQVYSVTRYQTAYIQQDVEAWIKENIPARHHFSLYRGFTVKFYMYDEVAWNLFGCAY